jgi:hypothetical protein
MNISRPLLAYLGAVVFLLVCAGLFFHLALAPLAEAGPSARADRPIPEKLLRSAERRAEDAALLQRIAATKMVPPKVETVGIGGGASVPDDNGKRAEATAKKTKARSAADRPRKQRALARSYRYREAYGAMSYAPTYERPFYYWR